MALAFRFLLDSFPNQQHELPNHNMKKLIIPVVLVAMLGLSGCVAAIGNRDAQHSSSGTLGQQLIDLQKAKEAGAISEAEYQSQKARLLDNK